MGQPERVPLQNPIEKNRSNGDSSTTVSLETIAHHEAAHAVMRRIRFMETTALEVSKKGGLSHGSGKLARIDDLLNVTLAGFAYEMGFTTDYSLVDIAFMIYLGIEYQGDVPEGFSYIYTGGDEGGDIEAAINLIESCPAYGIVDEEALELLDENPFVTDTSLRDISLAVAWRLKFAGSELEFYGEAVGALGSVLAEKRFLTPEEVDEVLNPFFNTE